MRASSPVYFMGCGDGSREVVCCVLQVQAELWALTEEVLLSGSHTSSVWEPSDRGWPLGRRRGPGRERPYKMLLGIINSFPLTSALLTLLLSLQIFVKLHRFMHFSVVLFYNIKNVKMKKNRAQGYKSRPLPGTLVTVGLWAVKIRIKTIRCY